MKNTNLLLIGIIVLLLASAGFYFAVNNLGLGSEYINSNQPNDGSSRDENSVPVEPDGGIGDGAEPLLQVIEDGEPHVIGQSADGADIVAYHFGDGDKEVVFVGGIHSGFAPGTVKVMNEYVDYLKNNTAEVLDGLRITIIPSLNPDSSDEGTGLAGRLNGNGVDINRNFDCNWKEEGVWRQEKVSGGTSAFSEPESIAFQTYIRDNQPEAVVAYYASAGGVYVSACDGKTLSLTSQLVDIYADASGYEANKIFDSYVTNGDLTNWLAKEGVPAISVLLTTYTGSEFDKNLKGINALLTSIR